MATANQIVANRVNACRSTGPRTAAGKATSARDARKHGLLAREVLAEGESAARFAELSQRLRRVVRLESAMLANEDALQLTSALERGWLRHDEADWLRLFSQHETRLDRMLHRALHELQRLQARRAGAHVPPPLVVDVDVHGLGSLDGAHPPAR